jgi:hypothetical protein
MPMKWPHIGSKEDLESRRKAIGFALLGIFSAILTVSDRVFVVSDIKTERVMVEFSEH